MAPGDTGERLAHLEASTVTTEHCADKMRDVWVFINDLRVAQEKSATRIAIYTGLVAALPGFAVLCITIFQLVKGH